VPPEPVAKPRRTGGAGEDLSHVTAIDRRYRRPARV